MRRAPCKCCARKQRSTVTWASEQATNRTHRRRRRSHRHALQAKPCPCTRPSGHGGTRLDCLHVLGMVINMHPFMRNGSGDAFEASTRTTKSVRYSNSNEARTHTRTHTHTHAHTVSNALLGRLLGAASSRRCSIKVHVLVTNWRCPKKTKHNNSSMTKIRHEWGQSAASQEIQRRALSKEPHKDSIDHRSAHAQSKQASERTSCVVVGPFHVHVLRAWCKA